MRREPRLLRKTQGQIQVLQDRQVLVAAYPAQQGLPHKGTSMPNVLAQEIPSLLGTWHSADGPGAAVFVNSLKVAVDKANPPIPF